MSRVWMQVLSLIVFLALAYLAASVGAIVNVQTVNTWYVSLQKPCWTPSGGMIGAIWTFLYACMAVAAWLVWRETGLRKGAAPLALWLVQLVLNLMWSVLFFGLKWPMAAFAELLLLWLLILATMIAFFRVTTFAGFLFIPYIAWVSFAGALNFLLWQMNP
jgi:translocator protein